MHSSRTIVITTFLTISVAVATTINVPKDHSTIQGAIDASSGGDTVLVDTGTYVEKIDFKGKNITVGSLFLTTGDTSYISQTVIDGNRNGTTVTFKSNEDSTSVLTGVKITNGSASSSGGIYCQGSGPSLRNLIVTGNTATFSGGGIYCVNNANPKLLNVVVTKNTATGSGAASGSGGGMYIIGSNPTLTNVTVSDNAGDIGGGIYLSSSSINLSDVFVSGNSGELGGGIYCSRSNLNLMDLTVSENRAEFGGGLRFFESSPTISNVMIIGNTADWGGGIDFTGGSPTMSNVTMKNNTANLDGGAIYSSRAKPTILKSTFSGNKANQFGGAIAFHNESSADLSNVVFSENSAGNGGAVFLSNSIANSVNVTISKNAATDSLNNAGGIYASDNSVVTVLNSILWNNSSLEIYNPSSTFSITYSDIQGGWMGDANIDADPDFVDAVIGDFHLRDYSPCIGAGDPVGAPNTDIEGNHRPDPVGSNPDLGAYENNRGEPKNSPGPFNLVFPDDQSTIEITQHNAWTDTLTFLWEESIDPDGDEVTYRFVLTDGLSLFDFGSIEKNIFQMPYNRVEYTMHTAGIEVATGTWTVVASGGDTTTLAINGPFTLTIDASALAIDEVKSIPQVFALHQNYPNPFNARTIIRFDLPEQSWVNISVYDLLGRKVTTLVNSVEEPGFKAVTWPGTDSFGRPMGSGAYLLRIQADGFTETGKMLLLR